MKLDKAKEILSYYSEIHDPGLDPDLVDALKLGTEAINYILRLRAFSLVHRQARLPSEDKDDLTHISPEELKRVKESPLGTEPTSPHQPSEDLG